MAALLLDIFFGLFVGFIVSLVVPGLAIAGIAGIIAFILARVLGDAQEPVDDDD